MKQLKYWRFLLILAVTGICFYYREQIGDFMRSLPKPNFIETGAAGRTDILPETSKDTENDSEDGGEGDINEGITGEGTADGNIPDENTPDGNTTDESTPGTEEVPEPKPVWGTVEEDYFDDAVFIGDSRTVGLQDYAGLTNTTFYASTGLTVYKLFDAKIVPVEGSKEKKTIEEALSERQFSKIYLMIGINEMGTGTVDTFIAKYKEVVAHLQELQPDAIIYVQAIMRVGTKRSEKGDYINNEGIDARNAELARLADNERIFYLDVNPLVTDEDGGLVDSYTFDGVHLMGKYVAIWKQFLLENAVTFE